MAKKRIKDLSRAETDGYLAVDNATNGTGKMNTSVIFNNFAPAFDPTRTAENAYKFGEIVRHEGVVYQFKKAHYGAWDAADVDQVNFGALKLGMYDRIIYGDQATNPASLNDVADNTIVLINKYASTATTDFPADYGNSEGYSLLLSFSSKFAGANGVYRTQILFNIKSFKQWTRTKFTTEAWSAWSSSSSKTVGTSENFAAYDGSAYNLSSLDDAATNTILLVRRTSATTTTNFPSDFGEADGVLQTYSAKYTSTYSLKFQILTRLTDNRVWSRMYVSATSTWGSWNSKFMGVCIDDYFAAYHNATTNLASLNDAKDNSLLLVRRTSATTTTNFPPDFGEGDGILQTYAAKYSSTYSLKLQALTRLNDNFLWYRGWVSATSTWGPWRSSGGVVTIGAGKMFTTLRDGLDYAFNLGNAEVLIYPGTYNLVEEFADVLPTINEHAGCRIGNGMHVVAMAGVTINALVEKGDLTDAQFNAIKLYFHPFGFNHHSSGNDDFVVENLVINSKNTRYSFHDDYGSSQAPCVHKFINCKMCHENTNTTASNNFINAIGGGLGRHTTVIVDGGVYRSICAVGSATIMSGDPDYSQQPIAYHNTTVADLDSKSSIIIKDVYFEDKGYFHAAMLGSSTAKTTICLNGNRFYYPPLVRRGDNDPSIPINMEVEAMWQNDIDQEGEWTLDVNLHEATWTPQA